MRLRGFGVVIVACATSACFATRNDVRILQADLLAFRAEAARADSARVHQMTLMMDALKGSLTMISDSVRDASTRLARFQGDTRQDITSVLNQLSEVQELTGQSQRPLQELRASMEERNQQPVPNVSTAPTTPGDTTKPPAPAPAVPGPNQLFQQGIAQKEQQSYSAARAFFEELLKNYPTSDLAPEAEYWIGEMLNAEGKGVEADSAYQTVLTKYPRSRIAARSMFRLGQSLDRQKRCPEATAMMANVVRQFPQSDEAALAKDFHCTTK